MSNKLSLKKPSQEGFDGIFQARYENARKKTSFTILKAATQILSLLSVDTLRLLNGLSSLVFATKGQFKKRDVYF
jgi:hypothetical protein